MEVQQVTTDETRIFDKAQRHPSSVPPHVSIDTDMAQRQGQPGQKGLGQTQAFSLLAVYCLVYVLPLYASASTRASAHRSRDDPATIKARIRVVSMSTAACSVATLVILSHLSQEASPLKAMGIWPLGLHEVLQGLVLTSLLFAGPLYECLLIDGLWRNWVNGMEPLRYIMRDWPSWRNMVAGPITEEFLFRAAAVPLLLLSNLSFKRTVFLSPLVFGIAHIHHFYEFRVTHPSTLLPVAIARAILQLTYTSIFGAYATFIFIRTGSLLGVILLHAMCNSLGLPRVWGLVEPYWLPTSAPKATLLRWSIPYYILLIGGSLAWWRNLNSLTHSPLALAEF